MSWDMLLQPARSLYRFLKKRTMREADNHSNVGMDEISLFHRQQMVTLDHLINVKVADLIFRMEEKLTGVPLNERKNTPQRNVSVMIYGKDLVRWFVVNMDIAPNEALYLAYLLSSHPVLHSMTNHYFLMFNFGFIHRYPVPRLRNASFSAMEADIIMDYEYVSYLCLKSMRHSMHRERENYEIDDSAILFVDVAKWKFEFIQAEPLINQ